MKHTIARRALLGAAVTAFAGLGAVALAQPARGPWGGYGSGMMGWGGGYGPGMMGYGPGPRGGYGPGGLGANWDAGGYLDGIKSELGITQAEEPAWDNYAKAFSGFADQMQALREGMWASMNSGSWDQHREFMDQAFEARQQAFASMRDASDRLLQALDPQQRQKARGLLPGTRYGYGYGPGWMMGGYGPGRGYR